MKDPAQKNPCPRSVCAPGPASGPAPPPSGGAAPTRGRRPERPRHPLERKLVLWTLAMIVVPTILCAVWLSALARQILSDMHARNVAMLGQTLAASLAGRDSRAWSTEAAAVLEALALDPRVAFVAVTDPEGKVLLRRVADAQAWSQYSSGPGAGGSIGTVDVDRAVLLDDESQLLVRRVPVWGLPLRVGPVDGHVVSGGKLEGFAIVALREPRFQEALARMRALVLGAACVVCLLSLPLVYWAVRHWTAPLRALVEATRRLSRGEEPQPVQVGTRDELATLATAFNEMAASLSAARRELEQVNQQLERKVQQRTAELQRVNQKLETEVHDKNEFLRAVSHDLGAPLRNIEGMAGMLLMKYKTQLADDALTKLERINANVKVQIDLINELLELSRLRTRPGQREPVDLHALVCDLGQNFAYDLERGGITLRLAERLPTVVVEKNRIRQVFQNLLDNAVKYMALRDREAESPKTKGESLKSEVESPAAESRDARSETFDLRPGTCGSPSETCDFGLGTCDSVAERPKLITVSWARDDDVLHFTVADTGPGIAPQDLPNLFQLFRRGTHSGAHKVAGRGVGLASVKAVVESYSGTIWVESKLGEGSTFHFTLSRRIVEPAPDAVASRG